MRNEIDLSEYTLVFEDDFDGNLSVSDDPNSKGDKTWFYWPPYGSAGGFSHSEWSADSHTMHNEGGALVNTAWWDRELRDHWRSPWRSGCLASMDKERSGFAQRFGYWECRAKMPEVQGQGAFPAFWLASRSGIPNGSSKGYEIDIFEYWSREPGKIAHTIHPWNEDGTQGEGESGGFVDVRDPINRWHTYGCRVLRNFITFYVDGEMTRQARTVLEYLVEPLYIILDYAVEAPAEGHPFNIRGDSSLLVDYVRAWSPPDELERTGK